MKKKILFSVLTTVFVSALTQSTAFAWASTPEELKSDELGRTLSELKARDFKTVETDFEMMKPTLSNQATVFINGQMVRGDISGSSPVKNADIQLIRSEAIGAVSAAEMGLFRSLYDMKDVIALFGKDRFMNYLKSKIESRDFRDEKTQFPPVAAGTIQDGIGFVYKIGSKASWDLFKGAKQSSLLTEYPVNFGTKDSIIIINNPRVSSVISLNVLDRFSIGYSNSAKESTKFVMYVDYKAREILVKPWFGGYSSLVIQSKGGKKFVSLLQKTSSASPKKIVLKKKDFEDFVNSELVVKINGKIQSANDFSEYKSILSRYE